MRIVCISDTHLAHIPPQSINVSEGDVLVHAGDATFRGTRGEIIVFADWFHSLPHKRKIFIPGNHDWGFELSWSQAVALLPDYVDVLNDSGVTIDGVKFWGSPWQPEFCDWAFNLPRGRPLKEHWDAIPEKTDVLVTHTPPKGVLDRVWRTTHTVDHNTRLYDPEEKRPQFRRFRNHVGCADLMQAVYRVQPRLHVFGHIHCDRGVVHGTKRAPRTTFINAAICNERYQPEHPPIIFDL